LSIQAVPFCRGRQFPPGGRTRRGRRRRRSAQVKWWTAAELRYVGLDRFEPHLLRALHALGLGR